MMQSNPTFGDSNRGVQIGAFVNSNGEVVGIFSTASYDHLPYSQTLMSSDRRSMSGLRLSIFSRSRVMFYPPANQKQENGS